MSVYWRHICGRLVVFIIQYLISVSVSIVRFLDIRIGVLQKSASTRPAHTIRLSSSDKRREILVDVYEPVAHSRGNGPLPVHVNFHGSSFVLPCHGSDAELCAFWATSLGCIVLDSDYAKGPKYPYPAAIDDACDVLAYVASKSDIFDTSKITVGGFSAGANIAILAALRMAEGPVPIKAIIAWYPPTNMARRGNEKKQSSSLMSWLHRTMRACYLPVGIDRENPRVSPLFEKSELFPPITLIVGEDDKLLADSVELADKLTSDGVDCILRTVPGASHAWERFVKKDTPLWAARDKALQLTERRLREVYDNC